MSDVVKFTVIVPTRERPDTLVHCLRTLVAQDYDNAEFIVSDNFSQDNTKEVVESFNDPRIRYINTGKRISMSHNWEFALNHVKDGWVTILGDDDGLMPGALGRIDEIVRATDAEAIISHWSHYFWPNMNMKDDMASRLSVPMGRGWEVRNSAQWLRKLMQGKAVYRDLPMLYTGGFVNSRTIDRARGSDGRFFYSCIPDVYSTIALASVTQQYIYLHEPVSVAGVSVHSNGASCLGFGGNSEPEKKFYSEDNIPFHAMLGSEKIKSIPMLVYESFLQSAHIHGNDIEVNPGGQLALAIVMAHPAQDEGIRAYCKSVCEKNSLDFRDVERQAEKLKFRGRALKVKDILNQLNVLNVDASMLGAQNVYDAALVSQSLHFGIARNRWWRFRKFASQIRRLIKKTGI